MGEVDVDDVVKLGIKCIRQCAMTLCVCCVFFVFCYLDTGCPANLLACQPDIQAVSLLASQSAR